MARFWTLSSSKACGCRSQTRRLKDIAQWGEGLLQRAVDGRPTDEASRAIQQGLDEQKVSAEYARGMRRQEEQSGKRVCRAGVCGNSTRFDALIGTTEGRPLRDVAQRGGAPIMCKAVRRTNCPSGSRSVLTHKGLPRRMCNRCATARMRMESDCLRTSAEKMPRCVAHPPRPSLRMFHAGLEPRQ